MKTTQVRCATRLMKHVEDLQGLGHLKMQEVFLIQDGLLLLIEQFQQDATKKQAAFPVSLPLSFPAKTYELKQRSAASIHIIVSEAEIRRRLRHVPIFSYSFGLVGLSALDASLAILADFFGEELSMRAFAAGAGYYCTYYRSFAKEVLPLGHFTTKQMMTFLHRERGNGEASVSLS
jgi:hypothetical protein